MLNHIKSFLESDFFTQNTEGEKTLDKSKLNLACAALLIEVAVIDEEFDNDEFDALKALLHTEFNVSKGECDNLIKIAKQEQSDATSTYQFTQLINQHCCDEEKYNLIKSMWVIAYADGKLDKYEEHVIRKVADLIYVPHALFIKAKIEARE